MYIRIALMCSFVIARAREDRPDQRPGPTMMRYIHITTDTRGDSQKYTYIL